MNEPLTSIVYVTWEEAGNHNLDVIRDYLIKKANEKGLKLYDRDESGFPTVYMKRLFEGKLCFCIYGSRTNLVDIYV